MLQLLPLLAFVAVLLVLAVSGAFGLAAAESRWDGRGALIGLPFVLVAFAVVGEVVGHLLFH